MLKKERFRVHYLTRDCFRDPFDFKLMISSHVTWNNHFYFSFDFVTVKELFMLFHILKKRRLHRLLRVSLQFYKIRGAGLVQR